MSFIQIPAWHLFHGGAHMEELSLRLFNKSFYSLSVAQGTSHHHNILDRQAAMYIMSKVLQLQIAWHYFQDGICRQRNKNRQWLMWWTVIQTTGPKKAATYIPQWHQMKNAESGFLICLKARDLLESVLRDQTAVPVPCSRRWVTASASNV